MSAFFDRFDELCRAHGETPNSVARKLGIPSGSITAWKKGAEPRNKTVWKLVDFFGVDFNYMLGRSNKPTSFRLENGKFVITRPKNSSHLSDEEMLAGEEYELEEIQKDLNAHIKKAPTDSKRKVSDDDIKFALFGGDSEITDAMYDEVKRFAQMVKLREEAEKEKK